MASSRKRPSAEAASAIDAIVAVEVQRHARRGETVTVALSGGIDSIVLLDAVRRLAPRLGLGVRALHVNHGLSRNAATWQRFCELHCKRRGVPFEAVQVEVPGAGRNLEANAREARYRVFKERGSALVALAHNLDDQAETLLLNLLRGSGVRGLAAMPAIRALPANDAGRAAQRLVRPLLAASREQIVRHAKRRKLAWIDDESNREARFARNYLRMRVLPLLERRFPGCKLNMARAATRLQEAESLLEEVGRLDYRGIASGDALSVTGLNGLGAARAANAFRVYLIDHGEPPLSSAYSNEALRQLTRGRRDGAPRIELSSGALARYRDVITWRSNATPDECVQAQPPVWNGERRLLLGNRGELRAVKTRGEGVSAARLGQDRVTIRSRLGGERMQLSQQRPRRTLKNLLQEAGVPPWQRARMPLVFCGEQLVWAPRVGVASAFLAQPGEAAWRFSWRTPEDARSDS